MPDSCCGQVGEEVKGENTRKGADGLTGPTAFVFPYPYTAAAFLGFRVTVVVGTVRSTPSDLYGPITVGAWLYKCAACTALHRT